MKMAARAVLCLVASLFILDGTEALKVGVGNMQNASAAPEHPWGNKLKAAGEGHAFACDSITDAEKCGKSFSYVSEDQSGECIKCKWNGVQCLHNGGDSKTQPCPEASGKEGPITLQCDKLGSGKCGDNDKKWLQSGQNARWHGGHWAGVRGNKDAAICGEDDPMEKHKFKAIIYKGRHSQVGVANKDCCSSKKSDTHRSDSDNDFAAFYSHHSGWNRHRGAARPKEHQSHDNYWHGTWDNWNKDHKRGPLFVTVWCKERKMQMEIPDKGDFSRNKKAIMTFPNDWKEVYPFFGGQSKDHQITMEWLDEELTE